MRDSRSRELQAMFHELRILQCCRTMAALFGSQLSRLARCFEELARAVGAGSQQLL
jgi:hypothetical protein